MLKACKAGHGRGFSRLVMITWFCRVCECHTWGYWSS